jgi:Domain of unknown function (DUF4412)
MRRALLALFVLAACGREIRAPEPQSTQTPTPKPAPGNVTVPVSRPRIVLSAQRCGGDGGYAAGIDCFRVTAGYRFVIVDGAAHADGEMARRTPGAENVRFRLTGKSGSDGEWLGIAKQSGIVWYRDGKRVNGEPAIVDDIYQRTTLVFDPQKKEREAKLGGVETIDSIDCNHYRFTDANNGEVHDVWISKSTGDFVRIGSVAPPQFRSIRPDFTMTLSRQGERPAIEEPK